MSGGTALQPWQRPPFERRNLLSLTHGAYSRFVLTDADELAATLVETAPHLTEADAPAIRDYAIAQARAWRLARHVEEHGELDERGDPRPILKELSRWLSRAEIARSRLGLDPTSRAALAVDELAARRQAGALAREELDEGRRLRLAAEARDEGGGA